MAYQSSTQYNHDKINLISLVRKLELAVNNDDWADASSHPSPAKVQGARQKVRHALKLLNSVKEHEVQHSSQPGAYAYLSDVQLTLDRLSNVVQTTQSRVSTSTIRPAPILPTIPAPTAPVPPALTAHHSSSIPTISIGSSGNGDGPAPLTTDLLLGPDEKELASSVALSNTILSFPQPQTLSPDPLPSPSSLPPPPAPAEPSRKASSTTASQPAFLQNSQVVQEELSAQLAAMATQLRRNAEHFAQRLDEDKGLVEAAGEKLERNHDVMTKERVRLRDRGIASRGSTCFVVMAVVAVVVAFAVMVLVIRVT